jgi:predicted TIM-barrel fold metal-dependent hydrolase
MSVIETLQGRINDADSHEMVPARLWGAQFGDIGGILAQAWQMGTTRGVAELLFCDVEADDLPVNPDTVWKRSGWDDVAPRAPGAIDMNRRLEVMDLMGVYRQLVFPTFGLAGLVLSTATPEFIADAMGIPPEMVPEVPIMRELGRSVTRAHNDWAVAQTKLDPDRLRMVAVIPTADFDGMMAETERVLAEGVRCLFIPASQPPGGKSPADRANEPFWSLCEAAGASVLIHIAFENFLQTDVWRRVPEFETEAAVSGEFIIDPWSFTTLHMVVENFIATMTLGGVFERHPDLRFGVIECSAQWVGPLAENMDMWAGVFRRRMSKILSMPPSEYLARNLRVTPYIFEPVTRYVERYGLEEVYCYGSDYPHIEGGTDQLATFAGNLSSLGPSFLEKFFVTNAELIMPPAHDRVWER